LPQLNAARSRRFQLNARRRVTMAYKLLDNTDIKGWNTDYQTLTDALATETDATERAKLTARQQALGTQVEEHLNAVGRQIRAYFTEHKAKVDNWQRLSEQAITNARKAASTYKKDTSTGVPPQLQQAAADMALWAQAIAADAQEFGAAWFHYRATVANKVPGKYQATFIAMRSKVMEDQKTITTKQTKIKGYVAEAEGLVKLAAKATMKSEIKAGTGVQRPIADAQRDANELAAQMAAELVELRSPRGLATQPAAISNAMSMARNDAKNKGFTKTTENATAVAARKKTFESGIKLMRARAASMEKVLAVKTKAFRSSELADATVKASIKAAKLSLKDAKADLKVSEAEAKKGQDAIAEIEKRWASKAKKK
jgi:hypothetical protein